MNSEQRRLFDELGAGVVGVFDYEYRWDHLGQVMFTTFQGVEETLDEELASHLSASARDALAAFSSTALGKDILARMPESQRLFDEPLAVLKADAEKRLAAVRNDYQARMRKLAAVK